MKYLAGILVALACYGCADQGDTADTTEVTEAENIVALSNEQLNSFTRSSVTLQQRSITQTLRLNGMVEVLPQNLVSVSSALGGYVKSTKLVPGMALKKGEVIAELEDQQFVQLQQDYLVTKAQLENAEAEYVRQRDLNQSKASSDKVYLQAKADYQTLQINLHSLVQKLKLIHIDPDKLSTNNIRQSISIYAPFDGFVSKMLVNVGKYVSPSDIMFELVNLHHLQLNLKVFEKDWDKIKVGQQLLAYANSNPTKTYDGQVVLLGKNISEDRAVDVRVSLKGGGDKLLPGMYMNANLVVPGVETAALPEDCVVDFEGGKYVFEILDSNRFKMISVQSGYSGDGWVAIENPTQLDGKKIVQEGAYTLLMALKNKGED